jgi:hypothetical protein
MVKPTFLLREPVAETYTGARTKSSAAVDGYNAYFGRYWIDGY